MAVVYRQERDEEGNMDEDKIDEVVIYKHRFDQRYKTLLTIFDGNGEGFKLPLFQYFMREVGDVMIWLEGEIAEVDLLENGDLKKITKRVLDREGKTIREFVDVALNVRIKGNKNWR